MSTTATGNYALTLDNLATLIAASATFQAAVGKTGNATAAKEYVLWPAADPRDLDTRNIPLEKKKYPDFFAWMMLESGHEMRSEDSGGAGFFPDMPLALMFFHRDAKTDSARERHVKALNKVGAIIAEMEALAKTSTYLWVTSFRLTTITMSDPKEDDRYTEAHFGVQVF